MARGGENHMPAKNLRIINVGNVGAKPAPRVNEHPKIGEESKAPRRANVSDSGAANTGPNPRAKV
jgi:hypothetical protein